MSFKQLLIVIASIITLLAIGFIAGKEDSKRPECEYQVYIGSYSHEVWQNGRYVGEFKSDTTAEFDRLMIKDNE